MKILFLFILIFHISHTNANEIYEILKIPNLKGYNLNSNNKLKYFYAYQIFNIGVNNNIVCENPPKTDLDNQYKIIKKEFDKYDEKFLKKINLRYIVLCKNLFISDINTAGIPDYKKRTLIIDIKFNEKYFKRSIHHEIFHIIDDRFKEIFNKEKWSNLNDKNFSYAECSTCTNNIDLNTYLKTNGFITEYSKSTASEDMAEIFSHLMISKKLLVKNDEILKNKINFIKNGVYEIDKNFKF
tara:strand:- start:1525 stop:2247 length:723 start_codon:yes stop_codon:yes gene_type:complete